jgi:hypothetical protein
LDPQRQHARLLGLWAQAAKAGRRRAHRGGSKAPDAWIALGAAFSGRDFLFQFVPAPYVVMAMADPGPLVLVAPDGAHDAERDWRWPVCKLVGGDAPALAVGGGSAQVHFRLAARMGRAAWTTLADRAECLRSGEALALNGVGEAITVLTALGAGALTSASRADWPEAAALWRHGPRTAARPTADRPT